MRLLPLEFKKNGFDYRQVWRDEDYAIYEQSDNGKIVAYEVFKIKKNKAGEANFKDKEGMVSTVQYEAQESVPSIQKWGLTAFTVWTLEDARAKIIFFKDREAKNSTIIQNMTVTTHAL